MIFILNCTLTAKKITRWLKASMNMWKKNNHLIIPLCVLFCGRVKKMIKNIAHNGSGLNAVIKKDFEKLMFNKAQMINRITTLQYRHNGFFNYCRLSPCYVSVFFFIFCAVANLFIF